MSKKLKITIKSNQNTKISSSKLKIQQNIM